MSERAVLEALDAAKELARRGEYTAAISLVEPIVAASPSNVRAVEALGWMLQDVGQSVDAADCFERAIAVEPDNPEHHKGLGIAMLARGGARSAAASLKRALSFAPEDSIARFVLGSALVKMGRIEEAIAAFDRVANGPRANADAHYNAGQLLRALGRTKESTASFQKGFSIDPSNPNAATDLGVLLRQQKKFAESIEVLRKGLQHAPDHGPCAMELLVSLRSVANWRDSKSLLDRLIESESADELGGWVRPFEQLALPLSPQRLKEDAARFGAGLVGQGPHSEPPVRRVRDRRRLRIGYVSADFRAHPLSHLMSGVFGKHNRDNVEVFTYSIGPDDRSRYRTRIRDESEHFVDLARVTNDQAVAQIRNDDIDVLIDLMGYTAKNRFAIFAQRPAPVQATYMGFAGTLGSQCIDYNIVDKVIVPPEHASDYSESLVYLPCSYMATDDEQPIDARTPSRREAGLPESGVVYCCFNNTQKIDSAVFDVWMGVLKRVPGSCLWLLRTSDLAETNLRMAAEERGIDGCRLVFASRVDKPQHLARLRLADLVLDTFTFGAHTTAVDALWAGTPVLTCPGRTFASRVGASLLTAMNLQSLIASDKNDYEERAVQAAASEEKMASLREFVAAELGRSSLFDTRGFASKMEAACAQMWEEHAAGNRPRTIDVEAKPGIAPKLWTA